MCCIDRFQGFSWHNAAHQNYEYENIYINHAFENGIWLPLLCEVSIWLSLSLSRKLKEIKTVNHRKVSRTLLENEHVCARLSSMAYLDFLNILWHEMKNWIMSVGWGYILWEFLLLLRFSRWKWFKIGN
jgi:hypothetical protein